jgi:hypothetical protein
MVNGERPDDVTVAVRQQIFRSLAYVLAYAVANNRGPASPADLVTAIKAARPRGNLPGHRGIVRLLIFHGADPSFLVSASFFFGGTRGSQRSTMQV